MPGPDTPAPQGPEDPAAFSAAHNVFPGGEQPAQPELGQPLQPPREGIGSLEVDSPPGVPGSMAELWEATSAGLDRQVAVPTPGRTSNEEGLTPLPPSETPPAPNQSQVGHGVRPTPRQRLNHSRRHIEGRGKFFPPRGHAQF